MGQELRSSRQQYRVDSNRVTLEQVMKEIKQRTICVTWDEDPDRPVSLAPTMEPYVSLCAGGVKIEGEKYPALFTTEEAAIRSYALTLSDQVVRGSGVLYWRSEPEVIDTNDVESKCGNNGYRFTVYSQLLFSNKTVVKKAKGFYR